MSNQATPEQLAARTTAQQLAEAWYAVAVSEFAKLADAGSKVFDGLSTAFDRAVEIGWPELDPGDRRQVRDLVGKHGANEVLKDFEGAGLSSYGVRNYVAYVKAEIVNSARSDFLDEVADAMATAIRLGVTEDQLRADFEAQLSLQDFGEHRENLRHP